MSTYKTIISDLVVGLLADTSAIAVSSRPKMPNKVNNYPYIAVVVDNKDAVFEGASKYRVNIGLYLLTKKNSNDIVDLISDVEDYIKSASITNVSEIRLGEPVHEVVGVEDDQAIAATKMNIVIIYKDDNNDTPANSYPSAAPVGYMAIAHNKAYALAASGSTDYQALGTNVYDSHINANIEIPANSGSISVDINEAPVGEHFAGSIHVDNNVVTISIRAHFAKGTNNTIIAPFMWSIVDQVRKNVDLGSSGASAANVYKMLHEPFVPIFNLDFEESATIGAELLYTINITQDYTQT